MFEMFFVVISFLMLALFLPLPVFWLIFHRQIAYFRKHRGTARALKVVLFLLGAVFALVNLSELSRALSIPLFVRIVGFVVFAGSLYLTRHTGQVLGRHVLYGKAEIENKKVHVTGGVYRSIRHPRYLAVLLFIGSLFLMTGLFSMLLLFVYLVPTMLMAAIEEERELSRRLGSSYRRYTQNTGRFVPKFGAKKVPKHTPRRAVKKKKQKRIRK